jgi:hypothetical protein
MPTWTKTALMGVLGLCVAAGLGFLSLQLVTQPVGLSSEPLTAGNSLVPAATKAKAPAKAKAKKKSSSPSSSTTTTAPANSGNTTSGSGDSIFKPSVDNSGKGKGGGDDDSDDHGGKSDDD